jgi:hypothetical protein
VAGATSTDYNPHHQPFQYYASTANPHHLAPASTAEIRHPGQANHQYDLSDFAAVVNSPDMPAVSFLKAADYQDGHAGYSDPIDEQASLEVVTSGAPAAVNSSAPQVCPETRLRAPGVDGPNVVEYELSLIA